MTLLAKKIKKIKKREVKYRRFYRGFEITHCGDGLRVTRLDVPGDKHTHLQSLKACYTVIDNVLDEKLPYSRCTWYLRSLIRLSTNENYIRKIEGVLAAREQKGVKLTYRNRYI